MAKIKSSKRRKRQGAKPKPTEAEEKLEEIKEVLRDTFELWDEIENKNISDEGLKAYQDRACRHAIGEILKITGPVRPESE